MAEMKTLNGFEIVDSKAREDIENLKSLEIDFSPYALKEDIPTIPTKVSSFENDKGYITEHQSLEGLATEDYVDEAIDNNLTVFHINLTNIKSEQAIQDITNCFEYYLTNKNICVYVIENNVSSPAAIADIGVAYPQHIAAFQLMECESHIGYVAAGNTIQEKKWLVFKQTDGTWKITNIVSNSCKIVTTDILEDYGYATTQYVEDKGYLTEVPTSYALKSYVNTEDIAVKDELYNELGKYAKKTEIPDTSSFITSIPSEYVTETELNAKGYLTEHQSLTAYALKTDIPTVPTNVSAFNNDAGYITDISSKANVGHSHKLSDITDYVEPNLTGYATEKYVDDKVAQIDIPETDLTNYALKSEIPTKVSELSNDSGYLTEHQSLEGYATEQYVDEAIAAIEIPEGMDLSEYAKKTDIPSLEGYASESFVINSISDNNVAIDDKLKAYATQTWVTNQGFLTQHQSLDAYALKSEIPDVSSYQTEAQVQALINTALGVIENGSY